MSRYTLRANANDGGVFSYDPNYFAARAGTGTKVANDLPITLLGAGQWFNVGIYWLRQSFMEWSHTPVPPDELCTSAAHVFEGFEHLPTGDPWSLEVREFDWGGGAVTDGDWVPGANITAVAPNVLATYPEIRTRRPAPSVWRSGSAALRTRLSGTDPIRTMLNSNKLWLGYLPGGNRDEYVHFGASEGTAWRPRLDYQTTRLSSLTRVQSASVQLSDGTTAYLDNDSGTPLLKHNPSGTTYTTVATLSVGVATNQFKLRDGAQALTLVRDASDNIYVVGPSGGIANGLVMQAFVKGPGYTWTQKTAISGALPAYDGDINLVEATWHNLAGGWVVAAVGHAQGSSFTNQTVVATLACGNARLGSGAAVIFTADVATGRTGAAVNAAGSGLDLHAIDRNQGVLATAASDGPEGEGNAYARVYRYYINPNGSFLLPPISAYTGVFNTPVDGDQKVKILPISGTRFVIFWNGYVRTFTVRSFVFLDTQGSVDLTTVGLSTLAPSRSQAWDAIYDPATGRVWIYYLDAANGRRLMRTGYDPNNNLADLTQTQVATNIGASGSSHRAIRMPRSTVDERRVLMHLGNRTGGGALSTVTIAEVGLNQPPATPVLGLVPVFSSTQARLFTWTFSDPNPRDAQSAYEVEIRDQSSLVSAYDPGKVTSTTSSFTLPGGTLSNNETYEWRVKTYDSSDTASAWSAWTPFSTTTAGIAEITVPAVDNAAGLASSSVQIEWTFTATGVTQAEYRVRAVRTDTGDTIFDSGYLGGPDTRSYTVNGLLSDVEQRVELLVKDSSTAVSNTATRLVTPSFGAPDIPLLIAQPTEDGGAILIQVTNPEPSGELPAAGRNDIYRTPTGTDAWIKIGEASVGGTFLDWTAASAVVYDYRVHAVADGEAISEPAEGVVTEFLGVYLHLPTDADATAKGFLFGGSVNSDVTEVEGTELRFVGRPYPVFEYGDQQSYVVSVSAVVPFGPEHTADVEYLRAVVRSHATWCFRDGRGRKVFGVANSADVTDEVFGSTVSLSVIKVDYDEVVPS